MSRAAASEPRCSGCGAELEECAFCQEPDCPAPICYGCLNVALGQDLPQPPDHDC